VSDGFVTTPRLGTGEKPEETLLGGAPPAGTRVRATRGTLMRPGVRRLGGTHEVKLERAAVMWVTNFRPVGERYRRA